MKFIDFKRNASKVTEKYVVGSLGIDLNYLTKRINHEIDVFEISPRHLLTILEVTNIHSSQTPHIHAIIA